MGAAGHVAEVVLREPALVVLGTMEILSLAGCFFPSPSAAAAGAAVFLAGPWRSVQGGGVAAGGLVAAGPVVVMLATWGRVKSLPGRRTGQLVSGKTGDDIKNAEREKAKELLELSKIAKQKALSSSGLSTMPPGAFQGVTKSQQGSSKAGQVSPPGKQNAPSGLPISAQASQTKGIPTYMDDFKYGFPPSGLSSENMKWWGTSSHGDSTLAKDEKREAPKSTHDASKGVTDDDELDWGADEAESEADSVVTTEPSAQLCSLRRKAVDDGRKLLNGDARRGQELCRLHKRQKMVLAQVFGASLPEQWRSKLA